MSTSCTCEEGTPRFSVVEGCDGSASAKGGLCYTHAKNKNDAAGGSTEEEDATEGATEPQKKKAKESIC